jgi:hypothetical protein
MRHGPDAGSTAPRVRIGTSEGREPMRVTLAVLGFAACAVLVCFQSASAVAAHAATTIEVQQIREGAGRSAAMPAGKVMLAQKGVPGGRDWRDVNRQAAEQRAKKYRRAN